MSFLLANNSKICLYGLIFCELLIFIVESDTRIIYFSGIAKPKIMNKEGLNPAALHVMDKFNAYAQPRQIFLLGLPCMSTVTYHGKTTQHMAVEAYAPESAVIKDVSQKTGTKKKIKGYLVNMADKKIRFYRADEIIVHPLPEGAVVEKEKRGKKRQMKNKRLA